MSKKKKSLSKSEKRERELKRLRSMFLWLVNYARLSALGDQHWQPHITNTIPKVLRNYKDNIAVLMSDGMTQIDKPSELSWDMTGNGGDIVAWTKVEL
jgi:hypothetical protein